jgi:hypothetical protein
MSLALGLAALMLLSGCSDKEVPVIVDEDEIVKYLGSVSAAKEFLRVTDLFNTTPYTVPFDSAIVTDRVLGRERTIDIDLVPLKVLNSHGDSVANDPGRVYADYGYLGKVRESMVRVYDRFTLEVTRAYTVDTLTDTVDVDLLRYAFFLKLGSDSKPYVGWVLWGVNGIGLAAVPSVTVERSTGGEFRGDFNLYDQYPKTLGAVGYVKLVDIDTVAQGSRLLVSTTRSGLGTPTYQLISDRAESGAFTGLMIRYDSTLYIDSLSYQTPSTNPRYYNEFLVQMISETTFPRRTVFVVPYHY